MSKLYTPLGDVAFVALPAGLPMSETFRWNTDVFPAWNGDEERIQLMPNPAHQVKVVYSTNGATDRDVFNSAYGSRALKWAVPLWAQSKSVGDVAVGATSLPVGNQLINLYAGGLALLWGLDGTYRVLDLTTVTTSSITFPALPAAVRNAYLMPLYLGLPDDPIERKAYGYGSDWTLNFLLDVDPTDTPAAPPQFLGYDLYTEPSLLNGGMGDKIKAGFQTQDYGLGPVQRSSPWTYSQIARPLDVLTEGLSGIADFRSWLMRRAGRYRPFWHPTFESNFKLTSSGALTTQIEVVDDSWSALAAQRTHLALYYAGAWHPFTITAAGVNTGAGTVTFTLDASLGGVDAAAVECVSYLGLYRLDTDMVNLNWLGNAVCRASMNVLELKP